MRELEAVLDFVGDTAFVALIAWVALGFCFVWGVAAILSWTEILGGRGVFKSEIRGFKAWSIGFVVHALGVAVLAGCVFLWYNTRLMLLIPYAAVIIGDFVLFAVHSSRARKLASVSK